MMGWYGGGPTWYRVLAPSPQMLPQLLKSPEAGCWQYSASAPCCCACSAKAASSAKACSLTIRGYMARKNLDKKLPPTSSTRGDGGRACTAACTRNVLSVVRF